MNIDRLKIGFIYTLDHIGADGRLISSEKVHNLMPSVARDYILNAALLGAVSPFTAWYVGIYSSAYTPVAGSTMTEIISTATEITSYTGSVRPTLVPDALSGGIFANTSSKAAFAFAGAATIRGGFIASDATHGSSTGLLLSAGLFPSPKVLAAGETLNVTAGLSLAAA